MNKLMKSIAIGSVAFGSLASGMNANALNTTVAFDTDGTGTYDIAGITSLDWEDNSSIVIEQTLVSSSTGAPTLNAFFGDPTLAAGDSLTFRLHANTRLTAFSGGSPNPSLNLDSDGAANGATGFEVTGVLSIDETATVLVAGPPPVIQFGGVTGSFALYWDDTPDSNNATGAGFIDGTNFLSGTVASTGGTFVGAFVGQGASFLTNTITSYDSNFIEADDPLCGVPGTCLIGGSFNSTLDIEFGVAAPLTDGGLAGVAQYAASLANINPFADDLLLAHDSTTQFTRLPEPTTLLLLSGGLLGLSFARRRKA